MSPDNAPEPFEPTSDPDDYVPRPATEDALSSLASFLRVGATQVFLTGPSGIGKSILLRVLAARLAPHWQSVIVPYPALPPEEIAGWILGLMGEQPGSDPERTLINHARRLRDTSSGLAILVDDAASMPLPTVRRLSRLSMEARPALPLVLALPDDERCAEIADAIGPGVEVVLIEEPLSGEETRAYLDARLQRAGLPEAERETFLDASAAAIHRESQGTPYSINSAAAASWRRFRVQRDGSSEGISADSETKWRLGSALLGPSGPEVVDPWLDETQIGETVELDDVGVAEPEVGADVAEEPEPQLELGPELDFESDLELDPAPAIAGPVPEAVAAESSSPPRALVVALSVVALLLAFGLGRLSALWPDPELPAVSTGVAATSDAETPVPELTAGAADAVAPPSGDLEEATSEFAEAPQGGETSEDLGESGSSAQDPGAELAEASEAALSDPFARDGRDGTELEEDPLIQVSINAVPWAEIEIDGEAVGITPLADLPLERGTHLFRATFPDGRSVERVETVTTLNRRVLFR